MNEHDRERIDGRAAASRRWRWAIATLLLGGALLAALAFARCAELTLRSF